MRSHRPLVPKFMPIEARNGLLEDPTQQSLVAIQAYEMQVARRFRSDQKVERHSRDRHHQPVLDFMPPDLILRGFRAGRTLAAHSLRGHSP